MKQLNLMGSMSQTGYGVVTYNILKQLTERGWEVSMFAKGGTDRQTNEEKNIITKAIKNAQMFPQFAPCLNVWHQHDLANRIGYGKYIAYPFFELDCFNEMEKHHLSYPDELIVSSQWAKDVLEKNKVFTTTNIVSPGVDLSLFNPHKVTPKQDDTVIFLNCGKWEIRKGHDFLIDIFHQAFDKNDNVELWLMPTNMFLNPQEKKNWEGLYLNTPLGKAGKIKILPWVSSHAEVSKIMSVVDCGVFPSRAEGWNLELLEMMAMGKPVIATNYSAHTEFCNKDNCMLIDINDVEPAFDGKWFFEQGNWAVIGQEQLKQVKDYMRYVYESINDGNDMYNMSGVETSEKYSWENCAEKLENILTNEGVPVEYVGG